MGFRKDFLWGAATAAYQIEGAAFEDGKGLSIWDTFSNTPGKVFQNHTGNVATDHYHRFREDVALMAELGIRNYRFSLSWPRILPNGTGEVNPKGIAFYNELIDELLAHGIRPFVTLFHWDYPQALENRGAWLNPDSPKWFREYAEVAASAFGDRVKDFIPFNEPQCFLGLGYQIGGMAPGVTRVNAELVPMVHNALKAHGEAIQALRELVPDCRVGYAPCGGPAIPQTESPEDIEAARKAYFSVPKDGWTFSVPLWSDPVLLGAYPKEFLDMLGSYLPTGWEDYLQNTIRQKLDFYGQNIYTGDVYRAADNEQGWEKLPLPAGFPKTACDWAIMPEALYWGPRFLYERYKTPIIITENGLSCHDTVSLDGRVHDPNREDYLHRYLLAYRRAAEDGVDLLGYFQWSFLDNYEWMRGYNERFGMVYVDYATGKRTVKDSAYWYRKVMETNGENL